MAAAGYNARPEVVQLLMRAGADVNAWDSMSMTALSWAAMRSSNPQVIRVILDAGADAEGRDVGGDTPLMFAARYNPSPAVLAVLVAAHPDLEARDHTGADLAAARCTVQQHRGGHATPRLRGGSEGPGQPKFHRLRLGENNAKLRGSRVLSRLRGSSGPRRPQLP